MEHIVYSFEEGTYIAPPPLMPNQSGGIRQKVSKTLLKISRILAYLGIFLILVAYIPSLIFWVQGLGGADNFQLSQNEVTSLSVENSEGPEYLPPYDPKLPKQNKLTIKAIGVDAVIQEATYDNYEQALKKGVWRVSDFGSPTSTHKSTILAAHRYGYLAWTNSFRRTNSFFNLPKLKVGDVVEIVWQQRKYKYEIYAEGRGEEISDYSADLILYTCESLNGPVRIFKYAKLIKT